MGTAVGEKTLEASFEGKEHKINFLKKLGTVTNPTDAVTIKGAVSLLKMLGFAPHEQQQSILNLFSDEGLADFPLTVNAFLRLTYHLSKAHPKATQEQPATLNMVINDVPPNQIMTAGPLLSFLTSIAGMHTPKPAPK